MAWKLRSFLRMSSSRRGLDPWSVIRRSELEWSTKWSPVVLNIWNRVRFDHCHFQKDKAWALRPRWKRRVWQLWNRKKDKGYYILRSEKESWEQRYHSEKEMVCLKQGKKLNGCLRAMWLKQYQITKCLLLLWPFILKGWRRKKFLIWPWRWSKSGNSLICQLFQGSRWTNTLDWWCRRQGDLGLVPLVASFKAGC